MGIEMTAAPIVTISEPRTNGRMPSCGGSEMGYHLWPKINFNGETLLNTARPSLSKKKKIKRTKTTEANPQAKISFSIRNSLSLRILIK